jgi:acyl-CoA synthetase (AMP-forming)/AMP-acid ligase II
MVQTHARLRPTQTGAVDSQRSLSFAEWDQRASALATGLLAQGLKAGDRVAVLAFNRIEWLEIYVALARAGCTELRVVA